MYLEKALQRINGINWDVVGSNLSQSETHLGYEFLRRLAHFFKEQSQKPVPPLYANIAKLLGDEEEVVISDYCNEKAIEFLDENKYVGKVFGYYLQLAKYTDKNPDAQIYLDVYDPLIRIIERGGLFILKHLELDIVNVANFPLNGWYERFVVKEAIDIENL
ncbi:hypothetical protein H8B09_26925 [Paenibacillus sp. PR3]|uniref:Uncharacterized protein n=1 Tax=Paenibacillus terricola TaxID=2763503 RepID=A0ABR8N2L3_9BACL|nr:hypothetical protein [Paenibacillus terricola]MBD3922415.1 hypothetical protein [Paenibacillus terricola]